MLESLVIIVGSDPYFQIVGVGYEILARDKTLEAMSE